jgi:hypothetical protein
MALKNLPAPGLCARQTYIGRGYKGRKAALQRAGKQPFAALYRSSAL